MNFDLLLASLAIIVDLYGRRDLTKDKNEYFPDPPVDYSLPEIKTYDFIIGKQIARGDSKL
jgi:hypothetical protein